MTNDVEFEKAVSLGEIRDALKSIAEKIDSSSADATYDLERIYDVLSTCHLNYLDILDNATIKTILSVLKVALWVYVYNNLPVEDWQYEDNKKIMRKMLLEAEVTEEMENEEREERRRERAKKFAEHEE
ncbi:MAG: hypothetical protein LBO66_07565 [Deltaproteobacteria bacterium]|jgi:hypothetical protein|nr:hypothetical protein [Deltaproteobacteria bacterium]